MKHIGGFTLICLILTLCYFIGLIKYVTENEEDKCEMTYMFEYPQYVKISNAADRKFKKYGLYAYSEGRLTERTRNMYFDGIPVLFIPGNKGSHKQVRSLASIALRKWLNSRIPFHFDFFTVDLNEEYSGMYGPLLYDQLHYVNASLHRVLNLYQDKKDPPKSIILIGHSMGGVVALKLLSVVHDTSLVPIVITLASPLKRPPTILDFHMESFYKGIFSQNISTSVVSVAGGYRDLLICPFLTQKQKADIFHVMTSNIPISWTETNHVQILWCKQVAMALIRALFDSVDTRTRRISLNSTYRNMVFEHHLIQHSGTNVKNRDSYSKQIQMNQKGNWIENIRKHYSIDHSNGLQKVQWYMVAVTTFAGYEKLTVLAINLEVADWVFACNAYYLKESSRICHEGYHLSHKSQIAPSSKYKRRLFQVDLKQLKKEQPELTHIVFRAMPTDEPLEFHVDIHGTDQRALTVQLPGWLSLGRQVILEKTDDKAVNYEIVLPQLNHIVQYYRLFLEPLECSKAEHHASITLTVPWSNENYHAFVTSNVRKPFNVKLFSSRPPDFVNSSAVIKLILDPSCTYRISMQSSIFGAFGQLARIYSPLLLTNVAAVALMALRHQLRSLNKGYCSILFVAIQEGAKPYYVLTGYKLISRFLSSWFLPSFLPKPDYIYLLEDGIDFFILPLVLYLCSVGIFWMLTLVFSISLVALESTIHKLTLRLLARTVSFNMAWSDYLMSYLHKVPVVVALTLISISLTTCGGLALCLGAVFYFLRLTQMSQDFVEQVVWYVIKKAIRRCKEFLRLSKTNRNVQSITNNQVVISPNEKHQRRINERGDSSYSKTDKSEAGSSKVQKDKLQLGSIETTNYEAGDQIENKDDNHNLDTQFKIEGHFKDKDLHTKDKAAGTDETTEESDLESNEDNSADDEIVKTEELDKNALDEKIGTVENLLEAETSIRRRRESDSARQKAYARSKEKPKGDPPDPGLELSDAYNAIFFHSTIFALWCIVTVINLPAVLTWAHNFKYSTVLMPDESFVPGFALSICALALWQFEFPKTNIKWIDPIEKYVMVMAVLSLVYGTISLYRLNYILTITIVIVTFHQLLAPKSEVPMEGDISVDESDQSEKLKYADMKTKME